MKLLIENSWLVPFFPLTGALVAAAAGRELREKAHVPVVVGIALAFLVSFALLFASGPDETTTVSHWLDLGTPDACVHGITVRGECGASLL